MRVLLSLICLLGQVEVHEAFASATGPSDGLCLALTDCRSVSRTKALFLIHIIEYLHWLYIALHRHDTGSALHAGWCVGLCTFQASVALPTGTEESSTEHVPSDGPAAFRGLMRVEHQCE